MRSLLTAFVTLFILNSPSFGQLPGKLINTKFGGSVADAFTSVTQLKNGNYVLGGNESSTDYQCVGNHGSDDFFLTSVSPKGQLLWQKIMGGSGSDGGRFNVNSTAVKSTSDGGFFLGGGTESNDGDISGNHGGWDIFIAKCDSAGNIKWKRTYGGNAYEYFGDMDATPDGGCVFVAASESGANGDVPANHGPYNGYFNPFDVWVVKLDSSGNIQWSKMYGGSGDDDPTCIRVTPDGYIFASDVASQDGDVAGSVFNGVTGGADEWVVKLDTAGKIVWKDKFGGSGADNDGKLCVGSDGNFTMVCSTRSADGDFGTNYGLYDIGVIRIAGDGSLIWRKIIGGDAWDTGDDIVETPDGNLEIAGLSYSYNINGIPIPARGNTANIILCKLNKNTSDFIWLKEVGGTNFDKAEKLLVNKNGDVVMAGQTSSSDYDFSFSGFGSSDGFITVLAQLNSVSGYVFNDTNGNGVKDANESYMNKVEVTTTKFNGYGGASYSYNGSYYNEVDSGTYITKPKLFKPEYYTVIPDSITTTFPSYYGTAIPNFGITPIPGKQDIAVKIFPITAAHVGSACTYYMVCYNTGTTTIQNGTAKFAIDPGLRLQSADPAQTNIVGDTLFWQYTNFKPFDTLAYKLTFNVVGVYGHYDNYVSKSTAQILPITNDLVPSDNVDTLKQLLLASFDPNEKSENHADTITTRQVDKQDYLTYTIRFQNTGNDTARKVQILDTLDNTVDWNSFQMLYSSNDYKLKITNSNILQWTFPNILLPDSNVNEPASHGFISYIVKPVKTLVAGEVINNTAGIYFDYNDPVLTNMCKTLVVGNTSTLPLVVESFIAQKEGNTNVLHWISAQTIASGEFYIERSNNGINFDIVGKKEISSSSITTTYSYTDNSPENGLNYYRIKLVTDDGGIFYTEVKKIDNLTGLFKAFVYPNPTGNTLHLHINVIQNDPIYLKIYANDGKLVAEKNIITNGSTDYSLNVSNFSPGNYFILLINNHGLTKLQFTK